MAAIVSHLRVAQDDQGVLAQQQAKFHLCLHLCVQKLSRPMRAHGLLAPHRPVHHDSSLLLASQVMGKPRNLLWVSGNISACTQRANDLSDVVPMQSDNSYIGNLAFWGCTAPLELILVHASITNTTTRCCIGILVGCLISSAGLHSDEAHISLGLCRSINPHIAPTLDAFRRTLQPATSGRATGRSCDGAAQPPPLSTYAPRQPGATPLAGRGDRSVSGISSFAFQVQSGLEAVRFQTTSK
jgi:hypothetical protein